jgi:hypothetical protein
MMTEAQNRPRIWVALDQSPRSTAALTAAATLAAELDAELAGLFVEDIDLQHLIGLPFAREFSLLSGSRTTLSQAEMERSWRHEAEAMQRLLAEAAGSQRLRWSFHVTRGRLSAEVSALAQALDLVVLGRRTCVSVRAVTRTTVRRLQAQQAPGPVLVLFEDAAVSARSLDTAVSLARRSGAGLVVLVRAEGEAAYRDICRSAEAELKARGAASRCLRLAHVDGPGLLEGVRREQAGCLVLADRERLHGGAGFERMLDEIECPIVLTR